MAGGSLHKRSFQAVAELCYWIFERRTWAVFDGWCAARGVDPLALNCERFINLATYYAVEEAIVEHRPLNEKHLSARRELHNKLLGYVDAFDVKAPVVLEVEQRTGIKPPAWFNVKGTTISDVERMRIAATQGGRK